MPLALRVGCRPMSRQPQRLVGGDAPIGLHQALGHRFHAFIRLERQIAALVVAQLVHPACQALRCLRGDRGGQTKALQIDQTANALGPRTGVHHAHVSAHAVTDEVNGLTGREVIEQLVQIGQIVGEHVEITVVSRHRAPKAAPVGGDDQSVAGKGVAQRVHHELVGRAHIHPAMNQHQWRLGLRMRFIITPDADVVVQCAHGHGDLAGWA